MQKPLGYQVFRGYGPKNFYLYNRDKKNLIVTVEISKALIIKSQMYQFKI